MIPAWLLMWCLSFFEFGVVKLLSLRGARSLPRTPWRLAGYLVLWPGMNAPTFLDRSKTPPLPTSAEWCAAFGKTMLGLLLALGAIRHSSTVAPLTVGWAGMLGLILLLHFGAFHLLSCAWRRAGVTAPPLMHAPLAAATVADFWSNRWNVAFAEMARRFVFRPVARRHGPVLAGLVVFCLSGLIHESVISLPARAGWGGPTLYFALQAAGIAVQRHRTLRRTIFTSVTRDRIWTILVTATPVPLLFHRPFVERVITPFLQHINTWIS